MAFKRMAESKTFQAWIRLEAARRMGQLETIEEAVNKQMADANIKVEYYKP